MASLVYSSGLTWINSLDGKKPGSPRIRRMIRSQAMSKAAAERKRKENHRNRKIRQYSVRPRPVPGEETSCKLRKPRHDTVSCDPCDDDSITQTRAVVRPAVCSKPAREQAHHVAPTLMPMSIPASPMSTGYEAMRIRYDFDVLNLSGLTALHVGRAFCQPLQEQPSRLISILRCKEWSYFTYIPSRYGNSKCLDDAICCVAARVQQWLTNPGKPTDRVLVLYAEAVKSLQAALDDPSQRMDQDVLGATEVLSIFELLDSERDGAWITHAAGAATLIQLRGPERWETCFEKALFLAQAGPIITEAMLKLSPCFLEEPAWQHLFRNVVLGKSPFSTYSDAFVKAWACISPVPGLFGSVRAGLKHPNELPEAAQARLLNRVLDLRARILKLGIEENLMSAFSCVTAESLQLLSEKGKSDPQLDLLGLYTTNLIRLERLIVALDSSAAMLAEARAQEMARQVLDLERTAISADSRAALSLRFKILIAKGTLSTWDEWRQEILRRPPNTMMDKNVFDHWALNICPSQSTRGIKSVST